LGSRPTSFRGPKIRARQPLDTRVVGRNQPGSVVRSGFFAKVLYVGDSRHDQPSQAKNIALLPAWFVGFEESRNSGSAIATLAFR
jgi:hypothetical protein